MEQNLIKKLRMIGIKFIFKRWVFACFLILFIHSEFSAQDNIDSLVIPRYDQKSKSVDRNLTQTIRGQVLDINTGQPLFGANVILTDTLSLEGTTTDKNGYFEIGSVTVGRQSLEVSYMGYNSSRLENLYVSSGKELVLTIRLEEKVFQAKEIVFKAFSKDKPLDQMAQVSARSFTVEETERFAGSVGDPSRMASSFAGVLTMGTQINDIIIRGNSTTGLLWRMEGLRIPNPNHFGDVFSSGGTSSMINNNVLSNSDFYTGAFPAEFGDALSGIFDLKLRKGNRNKREYIAQIGMGGYEFGFEGPFSKTKKRASYMANYRYSTMGVFDELGLDIGIDMIPNYQDLSYNINVPTGDFGRFSIFGLGGINKIGSETMDVSEGFVDKIDMKTHMGFTGLGQSFFINNNSSIAVSTGISYTKNIMMMHEEDRNVLKDSIEDINEESTYEFLLEYKNRVNSKNILHAGLDYFITDLYLFDKVYVASHGIYVNTKDINGTVTLLQSYIQWKHRFSDRLSVVNGIHYQYSKYGNDRAFEPRSSIKWKFLPGQSLSLGVGAHSKMQPKFIYHKKYLRDTINMVYEKPNQNLKMTRSYQAVLGYDYLFRKDHRLKIETYYQFLDKIPVERDSSYKSLINFGSSFSDYVFDGLVNEGKGKNYGIEVTLEKFLSKGYYYLFTLSLFESKYRASDGITRNTRFNANVIANLLGGYEWKVKKYNTFGIDGRIIFAGGERKIPIDYSASENIDGAVYNIDRAYEDRFKNYFRMDFRISYKINKKSSHILAIDVNNITARKNHFLAIYENDINDYEEVSTLSILPVFLWRWNF